MPKRNTPAPISVNDQKFIELVAAGEKQIVAFKLSFPKKRLSSSVQAVTASKLVRKYRKLIDTAIKTRSKLITQANESKVAQNALKSILTVAEVDEILCRELEASTGVTLLKAIDVYYKRFGSNAPIKTANTDSEGNDVATFIINPKGVKPVNS